MTSLPQLLLQASFNSFQTKTLWQEEIKMHQRDH